MSGNEGKFHMDFIKNYQKIIDNGNSNLRRSVLDIINFALSCANPYTAVRKLVHLNDESLKIGHLRFDLKKHKQIYLLGAGKATYPIAKALEEILGDLITDGVIVCKYGQRGSLDHSRLYLSNHPVPDEASFRAAKETLAVARRTGPGDIVIAGFTGGSSALISYPVEEVTLEEKKRVNTLLLKCGANIIEINDVRKHLSQIKGGRLAKAIHPEAHLINLTVSDVIGDTLDYITCPTVPDTSSFSDACQTLTKYELWDKMPASVTRYLKESKPSRETPKNKDFFNHKIDNFILVKGTAACEGAEKRAQEMGFQTMVLSTMLEGESKALGETFAAIAKEILTNQRPVNPPCLVIGGGETTVKIKGESGRGGPNQEFAMGAGLLIDQIGNVVVAGLDSDGTDGPTEIAGGIVDNLTVERARKLGLDLHLTLKHHDVTTAFLKLGDEILTGGTGTNVNDLKLMLIIKD